MRMKTCRCGLAMFATEDPDTGEWYYFCPDCDLRDERPLW